MLNTYQIDFIYVYFMRMQTPARLTMPSNAPALHLDISISAQMLSLCAADSVIKKYPISTAKKGVGERRGSECTPRGWHCVRVKIGDQLPLHTVFVGRRPTGEIYQADWALHYPQRDWILTRILWLSGLEPQRNRYGMVDSAWRYIYIHGCPDDFITGTPASHGCIRMKNNDIMELFARIPVRTRVFIHE